MSQTAPLDVTNLLGSGNASVSHTSLDMGSIGDVFDGNTETLSRTPAINPMVVTLTFATARTLKKSRVWFLAGNNRWRVETADSLPDLNAGTGSFRVALDWIEDAEKGWRDREFSMAITCRHVRLKLDRLTGDGFVHLNEWQLFTEAGTGSSVLTYDPNGNMTAVSAAVAGLPVILTQPQDAWASTEEGAGLSVVVASGSPVTYQWKRSPGGTVVNGATSDSVFFPTLKTAEEGAYQVVVTNASGFVTSATARLYIDANGNRLPDTWEMTYFGNLNQTASGDYDADGVSNANEYQQGSNPKVNPSVPSINYWIAASGNFTAASNWSLGRVPVAGDTAVINQGTFTLPTTTATAVAASVVVNTPYEPIADVTLRLTATGRWRFNGRFRPANGTSFTVAGRGGQATVAGPTFLTDCNLTADGGATLSMETVSQYAHPGSGHVLWRSLDSGSHLVFPNLIGLTGTDVSGNYFRLQATGGTITLPELTSAYVSPDGLTRGGGIRFSASSSGVISAPKLASFEDHSEIPGSYLQTATSGRINTPRLLAPVGMNEIDLGESSDPFRFTSLTRVGAFTIHSGTGATRTSNLETISEFTVLNISDGIRVNFPRLTSINSLSDINVDDGANVTFDAVTAYSGPGVTKDIDWWARNSGTVLSFPELATITGTIANSGHLYIRAEAGSRILLPKLQVITKANDGSTGNSSRVELRSSATGSLLYAPALYIFNDNDVSPASKITQGTGSSIVLGSLSQQGVRGVALSGVTLPINSPLPITRLRRSGNVWTFSIPALGGKSYQLQKSRSLAAGSWTPHGSAIAGSNDWLHFAVPHEDPKAYFRAKVMPWP